VVHFFPGPAHVLSATAIPPHAPACCTVYIVQRTVEAARGLDTPYHGMKNLNLKWDAHIGLERPGTQNERIKIAAHPFGHEGHSAHHVLKQLSLGCLCEPRKALAMRHAFDLAHRSTRVQVSFLLQTRALKVLLQP